jgi:DNA repair protein RadC
VYVRELYVSYGVRWLGGCRLPTHPLVCPADTAQIFHSLFGLEAVELCGMLCVSTTRRALRYHLLSRGTLDSACVHPRDVFRTALLANASGIVLGHNHPSGDPTPSAADRHLTARLAQAGQIIGIDVLDHIVIGERERYWSFREHGQLY